MKAPKDSPPGTFKEGLFTNFRSSPAVAADDELLPVRLPTSHVSIPESISTGNLKTFPRIAAVCLARTRELETIFLAWTFLFNRRLAAALTCLTPKALKGTSLRPRRRLVLLKAVSP